MKVKFKDGTVKSCSAPMEQKMFRSGAEAGWMLSVSIECDITSDELDKLITADNISELTFTSEEETGAGKTINLSGYDKVTNATIRYSEEKGKTRIEMRLTKGV